ncbi:hypothetical protein [uncultured Imperialibacter sp.]|uniref:hypothetical protein n=1 Tax=uncultured Imperialibacter sp. TaxID=1672639 RepID=UPI0030DB69C1|tara:strand:+ start:118589 stop:119401 length:813 start_codon:yes stop_codon:yes gene_type:complete
MDQKWFYYLNNGQEYNTIILGSSRAEYHVNPDYFELSSFNLGLSGVGISTTKMLLQETIKLKKPKRVLLNVDMGYLNENNFTKAHRPQYLASFSDNPEVKQYIKDQYGFWGFVMSIEPRLYSIFIKKDEKELLKGLLLRVLPDTYMHQFAERHNNLNGFKPLKKQQTRSDCHVKPITVDSTSIQAIESLISLCKKNDVQVILFTAPTLYENDDSFYRKLANEHGVYYLNYMDLFDDPKYFNDCHHLYDSTARIFSKRLAEDIGRIPQRTY